MPAIAALSINNGATALSFSPASVTGNIAEWEYTGDSSYYDGRKVLTLSVSKPSKSKVARVKGTVTIPIMDPTFESQKNGEMRVNIDVIVPKISVATDRLVMANIAKNFLASTAFQTALADLLPTY